MGQQLLWAATHRFDVPEFSSCAAKVLIIDELWFSHIQFPTIDMVYDNVVFDALFIDDRKRIRLEKPLKCTQISMSFQVLNFFHSTTDLNWVLQWIGLFQCREASIHIFLCHKMRHEHPAVLPQEYSPTMPRLSFKGCEFEDSSGVRIGVQITEILWFGYLDHSSAAFSTLDL
eukprot:GFYU01004907.1.p2 GENE.GFYU01004907.1~~GFYU01004907.1.p2  ORF type:complete len:173 (+),score=12.92 GFYU01004907.1:744-1262(+)